MVDFDRAFVSVGLAWLIVGMTFGLYMGLTGSNQFVVVHVAMLLLGAVVLALYGLIYRAWPALNQIRLARLQFWFAVISVFGLVFGGFQFVFEQRHRACGRCSSIGALNHCGPSNGLDVLDADCAVGA